MHVLWDTGRFRLHSLRKHAEINIVTSLPPVIFIVTEPESN